MKDQWIEWFQDNQRHFFYGVTLVIAAFFVAFQIFGTFHTPVQNTIAQGDGTPEKWPLDTGKVEMLEAAVAHNPELETKFGAMIADAFIVQNDGERAKPFAEKVLERLHEQTPQHSVFARGSLLIAKGHLQDALKEAVNLKEELDQHTLLFGFNLIRIASLCQALKTPAAEHRALAELETYLKTHEKAQAVLSECFREKEVTLIDYIHARKTQTEAAVAGSR